MPASKPVENTKSGNEEKLQTQTTVVAEDNGHVKFVTSGKRGNAVKQPKQCTKRQIQKCGKFEKIAL